MVLWTTKRRKCTPEKGTRRSFTSLWPRLKDERATKEETKEGVPLQHPQLQNVGATQQATNADGVRND